MLRTEMETVKGLFSGLGGRISGRIMVAKEAKKRVQGVFDEVDELHNSITLGGRGRGRIMIPHAKGFDWQNIPKPARDYLELGTELESDPTIFIVTECRSSASRSLTVGVGEIGRQQLGPCVQIQVDTSRGGNVEVKLSCEIADQLPLSEQEPLSQIEQGVKLSLSEGSLRSDEFGHQMATFAHNQLGINRYLKEVILASEVYW